MTTSFNVTSVPDVRALVNSSLDDGQLVEIIAREEAYVARELWWPAGLGDEMTQVFYAGDPATGGLYFDSAFLNPDPKRAVTFWWIQNRNMEPLRLLRQARSVEVTDGSGALTTGQVRLVKNGTAVERIDAGWNGPVVSVTYTPSDLDLVRRIVIDLVRITLTETGFEEETIGEYRYSKGGRNGSTRTVEQRRRELIRPLKPVYPYGTMRVPGSSESARVGPVLP